MKKIVAFLICLALAFSFSSLWFLFFSTQGLIFIGDSVTNLSDGAFRFQNLNGSIARGFSAKKIAFYSDSFSMEINGISSCRLLFRDLLRRKRLTLASFKAKRFVIFLKDSDDKSKEGFKANLKIPSFPFEIHLKDIAIETLEIDKGGKKEFEMDHLYLNALLERRGLEIRKLETFLPVLNAKAVLKGRVTPEKDDNIIVDLKSSLIRPSGNKAKDLVVKSNIKGDLKNLQIAVYASGLFHGALNGDVFDPLGLSPKWNAKVEIQGLDPHLLHPSLMEGNLTSDGSFSGVGRNFQGEIEGRFSSERFDIKEFKISCGLEKEGFFSIKNGFIKAFNGTLDFTGKLWPDSRFKAVAELHDINPKGIFQEVKGSISGKIDLDGRLKSKTGVQAHIIFERFKGEINERPLGLSGNLFVDGQHLTFKKLVLTSAGSRVSVSGFIDNMRQDLNFVLSSPDLSDLFPKLEGSLSVKCQIGGTRKGPQVLLDVKGSEISLDDFSLDKLRLTFDSKDVFASNIRAHIFASKVFAGDLFLGNVKVRLTGKKENHLIRLDTWDGDLYGKLQLFGSVDEDFGYSGVIKRLLIRAKRGEPWRLIRPGKVNIRKDNLDVGPLCLEGPEDGAKFCTRYQKTEDVLSFFMKGSYIPLAPIASISETRLSSIKGHVDLDFNLEKSANNLKGHAFLKTDRVLVTFANGTKAHPLFFDLMAKLSNTGIDGKISGQLLDKVDLFGDFSLPCKFTRENSLLSQPISAKINFRADDLSMLHELFPEIYVYHGDIKALFIISGAFNKPAIHGRMKLSDLKMEYPRYGIRIDSKEVDVEAKQRELTITGRLESKSGPLFIEGHGVIEPSMPNLTIVIKGSNYDTVSMPHLKVRTSPELRVTFSKDVLDVTGTVNIPFARIYQVEIPESAILPTPDIQIKGQANRANTTKTKVKVAVNVYIGDDVRVDGYGLKGRIEGRLKIMSGLDDKMVATGILSIKKGRYSAFDTELEIRKGRLNYFSSPIDNPAIEVEAVRRVEDVVVGFRISGTLKKPVVKLFSDPEMAESEIARYLLGGKKGRGVAKTDLIAGGANLIISRLREKLGVLNELKLETGQASDDISLVVGTYLRPDLYLKFINDFDDKITRLILRYDYSKHIEFETETGERPSAEVFFKIEK